MNEEQNVNLDEIQKVQYPVHYHGYIHMFDLSESKPKSNLNKELDKHYGDAADELGVC